MPTERDMVSRERKLKKKIKKKKRKEIRVEKGAEEEGRREGRKEKGEKKKWKGEKNQPSPGLNTHFSFRDLCFNH